MNNTQLATFILVLSLAMPAFGMDLKFETEKLAFDEATLEYTSPKIKFKTDVKKCAAPIIAKYFERFEPRKHTKIELLRIKKSPVKYYFKGKNQSTYDGSKVHSHLEKLKADVLLLKFKVEKKC